MEYLWLHLYWYRLFPCNDAFIGFVHIMRWLSTKLVRHVIPLPGNSQCKDRLLAGFYCDRSGFFSDGQPTSHWSFGVSRYTLLGELLCPSCVLFNVIKNFRQGIVSFSSLLPVSLWQRFERLLTKSEQVLHHLQGRNGSAMICNHF